MLHKKTTATIAGKVFLLMVLVNVLVLKSAFIHDNSLYGLLLFTLPLLLVAYKASQKEKEKNLETSPVNQ